MTDVAVVGAGIAGLTCARMLHDAGVDVRVFEKSRGVGGRTATRGADPWQFDHGAAGFTVDDPDFAAAVAAWREAGVCAPWPARVRHLNGDEAEPWPLTLLVGTPTMTTIAKHLAAPLDVALGVRVGGVERTPPNWRLLGEHGEALGTFRRVVVAVPAPQARPLLGAASDFVARLRDTHMAAQWSVMVAFELPVDVGFDAARIDHPVLTWAAHNSSKPGRDAAGCWVLHAGPAWSEEHIEAERDEVVKALLAAFAAVSGRDLPAPAHAASHRWRYAVVQRPHGRPCLHDAGRGLAVCGEWCLGYRVEEAWRSGRAAALSLL